jgi:hypothetical protein
MSKRHLSAAALVVALLILFALWWRAHETPPPTVEVDVPVSTDGAAPDSTGASESESQPSGRRNAPTPSVATPALSADAVRDALDVLDLHGATRIRCPAGPLADGGYEVTGPLMTEVRFVTVREGEIFAAVWREAGRVPVARGLGQVAWLSWSDASGGWSPCRVETLEQVTVSGRVLFAGPDTQGHSIMGCQFGDATEVPEDGTFQLTANLGSTCALIVIRERGDQMGRSPSLEVTVQGDVDGVEVPGPPDEALWSPEQQAELAGQLSRFLEARLALRRDRDRPELEGEADGESARLLRAWADQEDQRMSDMSDQLEALSDPERQIEALVELFLGGY